MKSCYSLVLLLVGVYSMQAQPAHNADSEVPPYDQPFGFGANVGVFDGWRDENIANIAAGNDRLSIPGLGTNTLRQWLPDWFMEYWGFDIRVSVFEYYQTLGINNLNVFIGDPSAAHADPNIYCPGRPSISFAKLYEPIWDNGAHGTPVNDSNYFAKYCYELALHYKDYVKFWEILNEPDIDFTGNAGLQPGIPGNWWDDGPEPCDTKFGAPIQHYVRMLRIAYEVIKSVDPDCYIAVGGLGHPSFLDAILRNTDNPQGGRVSSAFPFRGGAYFDCMSFHSYPHYDGSLRYWNNNIGWFSYTRHSDAAVKGMLTRMDAMETVLHERGYNGNEKPEKIWINTETNIPRKSFLDEHLGSAEAQRNYVVKSIVNGQKRAIRQIQFYNLGDEVKEDEATNDFQLMGFYKNFSGNRLHKADLTDAGVAYKTAIAFLKDYWYDPEVTRELLLPDQVDGGAFRNDLGDQVFVLWAKTWKDSSETAEFIYSFPSGMEIFELLCYEWSHAQTGNIVLLTPEDIHLTGSPIILIPKYLSGTGNPPSGNPEWSLFPNPAYKKTSIRFEKGSHPDPATIRIFDLKGSILLEERFSLDKQPNHAVELDLGHLASGIYTVQVTSHSATSVKKLFLR